MPADSLKQPALSVERLQRKIAELENKKLLPPELVAIVSQVSLLHCQAMETVHFDDSATVAILKKLPTPAAHLQGAFLLHQEDFPLDLALAERLVPTILDLLAKNAPTLKTLCHEAAQALNADASLLHKASKEILTRQSMAKEAPAADGPLAAWEKSHPDSPRFFNFVIRSAILPSLAAAANLLGAHHDDDAWPHGHCPICGGLVLMGRIQDDGGARTHVCSFCLFEYRVPRLSCPFCLAAGENDSCYYASEDVPGYLLETCPACKKYLKLADFRQFDRVWLPLLDDLGSLALDLYARQMNFIRPTLSAWDF